MNVALKGAMSPLSARTGTVASATSVCPAEYLVLDWTHKHMLNACSRNEGSVSTDANSPWAFEGLGLCVAERPCTRLEGT